MKPEYAIASCVGKHYLFDSEDVEDDAGNLIGEEYPHEAQAKALCLACPVFELCRTENWKLDTGIIAAKRPDERRKRGRRARADTQA